MFVSLAKNLYKMVKKALGKFIQTLKCCMNFVFNTVSKKKRKTTTKKPTVYPYLKVWKQYKNMINKNLLYTPVKKWSNSYFNLFSIMKLISTTHMPHIGYYSLDILLKKK